MKTMKMLLMGVVFVMSMTVCAQESYKESLKAYYEACPAASLNMDEGTMSSALLELNKTIIPTYSEQQSKVLVKEYIESGALMSAVVDLVIEPVMKKYVTEAELNQLTKAMLTPEGKVYQHHLKQMNDVTMKEMETLGASIMVDIINGHTPADVVPNSKCPIGYAEKFYQYYDNSGLDNLILQMINGVKGTATAGTQGYFDQFTVYMKRNMKTIYLNNAFQHLTVVDLDFANEMTKTAAYKHSVEAAAEVSSNLVSHGMAIVMNYISWLEQQGINPKL